MRKADGIDDDCDIKNTLPAHLGAFNLNNSKRNMTHFIREINDFYENSIFYGGTDSLYIEKKFWVMLDEANLVTANFCLGKNDYGSEGIFYGFILAPKIKYVLTINESGIIQQHITFERFNVNKRLSDHSHFFKLLEG